MSCSPAGAFDDALDGIVLSGLTRQATRENELPRSVRGGDDRFHRMQHAGEVGFLLACSLAQDAFAGQAKFYAVNDVAVVRIGHGRGRLVHRVADEHQRFPLVAAPYSAIKLPMRS